MKVEPKDYRYPIDVCLCWHHIDGHKPECEVCGQCKKFRKPPARQIIRGKRPPTAPPAESVDDAKAWLKQRHGEGSRFVADPSELAAYAEQYATKQIERQTPAIIERFVEEVEKEYDAGDDVSVFRVMQTVIARRSGGEK